MKKQRTIRRTLLAMAIAAMGASGTALGDTEVEGNDDFAVPQKVQVGSGGMATIVGRIGNGGMPDVDYYSFDGENEQSIEIDIDTAEFTDGLDSVLHLFRPDGTMALRNRSGLVDPGSNPSSGDPTISRDPRIKLSLTATGVWKVAVSTDGTFLSHNGAFMQKSTATAGQYKLVISGLKSPMELIAIDIKPGNNDEPAPINLKSKGEIPVMLLSTANFDPFLVDVASLRFGRKGNELSWAKCAKDGRDHNSDGKPDRVCHFHNEKTGFQRGDDVGVLKGTFGGGKAFEGYGDLKVKPEKNDD